MSPVECNILTLTLWALRGKIEAKSRWCPWLGGAVPPQLVSVLIIEMCVKMKVLECTIPLIFHVETPHLLIYFTFLPDFTFLTKNI